ncbi:MAG: hypothetical protein IJY50_06470 [Clostridia bacterium]|nr:hypothetical protein [Clostridia bacterium]
MKRRVTLLGDSIRLIGYGEPVARALAEGFEVWQPDSNCRFAQHTLRELWTYASHIEGSESSIGTTAFGMCAICSATAPLRPLTAM